MLESWKGWKMRLEKRGKEETGREGRILRMTGTAVFTAAAVTVFVIESAIPIPVPVPGLRLGLANVFTLVFFLLGWKREALISLALRILLGSLLTGQMMAFWYSLSGGICCYLVMAVLHRLFGDRFLVLISIFGAAGHHVGQLLVAYAVVRVSAVFLYFPPLFLGGIVTGAFTGLCASFFWKRAGGRIRLALNGGSDVHNVRDRKQPK